MKFRAFAASAIMGTAVSAGAVHAQDSAQDPGAAEIETPSNNSNISGILIGTYQSTSDDRVEGNDVNDEANAQLYLFGEMAMGPGGWSIEVRGSTTPHDDGVTTYYGEVNDSVGETLNADGNGRFAVTQLFYTLPVAAGYLSVGLLDATGLLDANDIADDEYTQFLATSFVNDPVIDYPTFALGADYKIEFNDTFGYQIFVSSSGGLEDGADPTYGNVFDVGQNGKGVFVGNELLWQSDYFYGSLGAWYNGSDHTELADPGETGTKNYGAYTSFGGDVGPGQWVAWAGISNDEVSSAANFLALAYSQPLGDMTLGAGISRIGDSDDRPGPSAAVKQAEVYLRVPVAGNIYLTPDIQYIDNSGFDPDLDDVFVAGLRAGIEF